MVNDNFLPPLICRHLIPVFASETEALTPSAHSRLPSSSYSTLLMIAIRCLHGPRTAYPTISAPLPPLSPPVRRLCPCVKCPASRLSPSFVGAAPTMLSMMAASAGKRFSDKTQYRLEKHVGQQWREHASLPETLPHVEIIRALYIIQLHACLHAVVGLADGGEHSRWHAKRNKDIPQKGLVDGVICFG